MHKKDLKQQKEELEEKADEIDEALDLMSYIPISGENKYITECINLLQRKLETTQKRLNLTIDELNGPWIDKYGRINKGDYEGLYILPLLQAMAWSAKDFPTAMHKIAHAANDQDMMDINFTMRPESYKNPLQNFEVYGYLHNLAPEAKWELINKIEWDT